MGLFRQKLSSEVTAESRQYGWNIACNFYDAARSWLSTHATATYSELLIAGLEELPHWSVVADGGVLFGGNPLLAVLKGHHGNRAFRYMDQIGEDSDADVLLYTVVLAEINDSLIQAKKRFGYRQDCVDIACQGIRGYAEDSGYKNLTEAIHALTDTNEEQLLDLSARRAQAKFELTKAEQALRLTDGNADSQASRTFLKLFKTIADEIFGPQNEYQLMQALFITATSFCENLEEAGRMHDQHRKDANEEQLLDLLLRQALAQFELTRLEQAQWLMGGNADSQASRTFLKIFRTIEDEIFGAQEKYELMQALVITTASFCETPEETR